MIRTPRKLNIDGDAMLKEAMRHLAQPARRIFMQRSLTLGGLSMLTGCSLSVGKSKVVPNVTEKMSLGSAGRR